MISRPAPITAPTIVPVPSLSLRQLIRLCKPRVVGLVAFTAALGMFLATPGWPPLGPLLGGVIGIGLVATAAAGFNCLIEQKLDAMLARTRARPLSTGKVAPGQALVFVIVVGAAGMAILHSTTNPLTAWLTLTTFLGYGVIYPILPKPHTPQNIVIGGVSGAMRPVLGWNPVSRTCGADLRELLQRAGASHVPLLIVYRLLSSQR